LCAEFISPQVAAFLRGCDDRPEKMIDAEGHVRRGGRLRRQDRKRLQSERAAAAAAAPEGQTWSSAGNTLLNRHHRPRSALDVLAAKLVVQEAHDAETETLNGAAGLMCGDGGDDALNANANDAPAYPGSIDPTRERTSSIVQTALVFVALVKKGLRTLAFCKYRKLCEMVLRYALQDLHTSAPALVRSVASYRGGYEKEERRSIESELFGGQLIGVTYSSLQYGPSKFYTLPYLPHVNPNPDPPSLAAHSDR
jgi:hypothetical protein